MRSHSPAYYLPQGASPTDPAAAAPQPYQMMLPRPEAMLMQQRKQRFGVPWLLVVVAVVIGAEVAAPEALKPTQLAGEGAARFYGEIMKEDNDKAMEYIALEEPTRTRAHREMEYVGWRGRCNALGIFDQQAGLYCHAATQAFYATALPPARSYRQRYYRSGW
ncbi:MAG: hypothetical protein ROR55_28750 [Devosia sp.]